MFGEPWIWGDPSGEFEVVVSVPGAAAVGARPGLPAPAASNGERGADFADCCDCDEGVVVRATRGTGAVVIAAASTAAATESDSSPLLLLLLGLALE